MVVGLTGGGCRKTEANQTMDNAPMVQLMGGEDHVSKRLALTVHQVHTQVDGILAAAHFDV